VQQLITPVKQPVRNHIFHEITRSLCTECRRVVDAQVLIRDGAVYLRKRCPEHGWHEALVSSDAGWHLNSLKTHFFLVQVHGFMDEHTFDLKRLMKCCIHQLLPDGRAVPFCAYNNLGYREQVKQEQKMLP
jgi:uncharacterized radical SAM superfamily Fe-S cluster-containing enzyme